MGWQGLSWVLAEELDGSPSPSGGHLSVRWRQWTGPVVELEGPGGATGIASSQRFSPPGVPGNPRSKVG